MEVSRLLLYLPSTMQLRKIIEALERLAPLHHAEAWDNVGLLVQPTATARVQRILLTIDTTPAVVEEALRSKCRLIVSYHPPLFDPLKSIRATDPRGAVLVELIRHRVAVYSPHTALDAVQGGLNDWLADGVGSGHRDVVTAAPFFDSEAPTGQGRRVTLDRPATLSTLIQRTKKHLGLRSVKTAITAEHARKNARIETVAVCAGAGASVLAECSADVFVTGEMRHHDTLAALARGTSVILCDHTNTERGYLPTLKKNLRAEIGPGVRIDLSRADREPLENA